MAKYNVTYKCGCVEEMQLFGKSADREAKMAYYKSIECPHCRALAAQKAAEEAGLPALKGSDKQIAWAADIRFQASALAEQVKGMAKAGAKEQVESMISWLFANDSAAYWIDNRIDLTSSVMAFAKFIVSKN